MGGDEMDGRYVRGPHSRTLSGQNSERPSVRMMEGRATRERARGREHRPVPCGTAGEGERFGASFPEEPMFDVVTDRPRRRVWTPRTVAVSAGAHLLLLGIFVTTAESTPAKVVRMDTTLVELPVPPSPPDPQQKKGDHVAPRAPETVPATIPAPDPKAAPVHDDPDPRGIPGDVVGPPDPPPPPAKPAEGTVETFPVFGDDEVIEAESATVLPRLENERDAQRMLQRAYPPRLRDQGVTGRATVVVIIDRN